MNKETELRQALKQAQKALDDYLTKKPSLPVNMPLLVWAADRRYAIKRYFSHFDDDGTVWCFAKGATSYTMDYDDIACQWMHYEIDHNAPPIIGWLPVGEDMPEAKVYLIKHDDGNFYTHNFRDCIISRSYIIENYPNAQYIILEK